MEVTSTDNYYERLAVEILEERRQDFGRLMESVNRVVKEMEHLVIFAEMVDPLVGIRIDQDVDKMSVVIRKIKMDIIKQLDQEKIFLEQVKQIVKSFVD